MIGEEIVQNCRFLYDFVFERPLSNKVIARSSEEFDEEA
jgi:hypothetical protein